MGRSCEDEPAGAGSPGALLGLVGLLLTGCLAPVEIPPPAVPSGIRTVIVRVESGGERALWIWAPGRPWPPVPHSFGLGSDVRLTAWAYPETLEVRQLEPGQLEPVSGGRRLDPSAWTAQASLHEGALEWVEDPSPRAPPEDLGLPDFDWDACFDAGGCAPRVSPGAPTPVLCNLTCEYAATADPMQPLPPNGPGWVEQPGRGPFGLTVYAPVYPARLECDVERYQFYGSETCARVSECSQPWPSPPPDAGRVLYVSAAGAGGDGSRERPFGRLQDALLVAGPGDALLLGPGAHEVPARPTAEGQRWRGVCPAQARLVLAAGTTWTADGLTAVEGLELPATHLTAGHTRFEAVTWRAPDAAALELTATASATVRRAAVRGGRGPAFSLEGADLALEDVVVEGREGPGVRCARGHLRGQRLVLRGLDPPWPPDPVRTSANAPAGVEASGCTIVGAEWSGEDGDFRVVRLSGASRATLTDLYVRDLSGPQIYAVNVAEGSRLTLTRASFERAAAAPLSLTDGASAVVRDMVARDTRFYGFGGTLMLGSGTTLDLHGGWFDEPNAQVLLTSKEVVEVRLADLLVRTEYEPGEDHATEGLRLDAGDATFERVFLSAGGRLGVVARNAPVPNVLRLLDVRVEGALDGVNISPDVRLEAERLHIASPKRQGLVIGGFGVSTRADADRIRDLAIVGSEGTGLLVQGGKRLGVEGFRIERGVVGVQVYGASRPVLEGGTISGLATGVELYGSAHELFLPEVLPEVRFEGNRENVVRR